MDLKKQIADIVGNRVIKAIPLGKSNTSMTLLIKLDDDRVFVAKVPKSGEMNMIGDETLMLEHLDQHSKLPMPGIVHTKPNLLLTEYIRSTADYMTPESAADVGRHLAELHNAPADYFGFEIDSSVHSILQPNQISMDWTDFFANQRLRWATQLCVDSDSMPARLGARVEALIEKLPTILPNDIRPSLLHGDLWKGNILVSGDKVSAFLDPALYYGHSEMDLAFMSLFTKVPQDFYDAYTEIRPIPEAFFEERKWLYLIWPILISIRVTSDSYVKHLDTMLTKFGV